MTNIYWDLIHEWVGYILESLATASLDWSIQSSHNKQLKEDDLLDLLSSLK